MTQSGILLIDKVVGPSSAQVVHRVKKLLGVKKIGHLGTLDPFASGLLLLGVNEGTKIADLFLGGVKSYRALMVLGTETDTQDCTGRVLAERPVPDLSAQEIEALERKFTGELEQVPPMFSALKKDGMRLYQLAREGKEVDRAARQITISSLSLRRAGATEIEFDVSCSRGTYVRTLAHDMGQALGCGAHLRELRRTACEHLTVEQAVTVDRLEALCSSGTVPLIGLSQALAHLSVIVWDSATLSKLRQGQQDTLHKLPRPADGASFVRITDGHDTLVALAQWGTDGGIGRWRLARVFAV
ncbi:MAG: tRNA pseudouridine(55) synthase TruB [Deltaproteobacteria bacterium]|nr:tRNA pseudouridine(55) synthase TruB [Deltaproteobacteria bacterium]